MGIPDEIETGGVIPAHTHTQVFSSLVLQSVLNWGGGCLQYILEILNFVGVFLIIVEQTFKIMLIVDAILKNILV